MVIFSKHALSQIKRRKIPSSLVKQVVHSPAAKLSSFRGRELRRLNVNGKILEVVTKTKDSKVTIITAYYLKEEKL